MVGGRGDFEGRLEICFGGIWGTVCGDSWDTGDAEVVCRQLGYNTTGALALRNASSFGPGYGPIHLSDVGCTGSEQNLISCSYSNQGNDCKGGEDAGVQCSGKGEELTAPF